MKVLCWAVGGSNTLVTEAGAASVKVVGRVARVTNLNYSGAGSVKLRRGLRQRLSCAAGCWDYLTNQCLKYRRPVSTFEIPGKASVARLVCIH